jgi:hypothetical protein
MPGKLLGRLPNPMIKAASAAFACAALGVAFVPAAQAETKFYVNPEYNQGFSGATSLGGTLNLDLGIENGPFYAQLGPALATGTGAAEWGIAGKTGVSGKVSDHMNLYAEVSASKFDGADTSFGLKVGSKYTF